MTRKCDVFIEFLFFSHSKIVLSVVKKKKKIVFLNIASVKQNFQRKVQFKNSAKDRDFIYEIINDIMLSKTSMENR